MKSLLVTLILAAICVGAAPDSASAQVVGVPGFGNPAIGQIWGNTGYYPAYSFPTYTLPSYSVRVPGSFTYGLGYGAPLYGSYPYSTYGFGYAGYPGYGNLGYRPWYNYQVYRYRSPYTGTDYGTYWGWNFPY